MGWNISALSVRSGYAAVLEDISLLPEEFIYGGHLTALGAPMMVLSVSILFDVPVSLPLLFIAYLATLLVYSFDYYGTLEMDTVAKGDRHAYISKKIGRYPYLIAFYAALLLISLVAFANEGLFLLILVLAASGILYSTVFKNWTRKIPGFKNAYTSAVWALGCTFGLPMYDSRPFNASLGVIFLFMLARGLSNNVFFDLKDTEADAAEGLKTLPVLLGKKRTILLLQALNLAAIPILVAGACLRMVPSYALSMAALAFSTACYLALARGGEAERMGYSYYLLADAEVLLWPVVALIGKVVFMYFSF